MAFGLYAQNQANRWYFGLNAGMNFTNGIPSAIHGALNTTEGTTASCDSLGNLNFYSDGVTVWNKVDSIMPNGTGLFGNTSTTVSALAVPYPGSSNLHYLFTLDEASGTNGFCYSIIDMNLAAGNGDVTLKNIPIQSNVTEKLAAVQQLGTNNIWVTVHEWGTDAFYSYLVTTAGFQSMPVISNAGMVHTIDALEQNKYGQMKFNTCGTKLALAIGYLDTIEVLDFNPTTGIFSNPITLPLGDHVYGVEFSQDGNMLYVTRYNTGAGYADLVQFDLSSGLQSTIISSMTTISTNNSGTNFYYALQLAVDEHIYLCTSWSQFLGVVGSPEIPGTGCNFNPNGFDLDPNFIGLSSALGLPAFIQSYFRGEVACTVPIGISEQFQQDVTVVPSLSSTGFMLQFSDFYSPISFLIFDSSGRLVAKEDAIHQSGYYFGNNLHPGYYYIKYSMGNQQGYLRIAKM